MYTREITQTDSFIFSGRVISCIIFYLPHYTW